jgi:hypothetical protein
MEDFNKRLGWFVELKGFYGLVATTTQFSISHVWDIYTESFDVMKGTSRRHITSSKLVLHSAVANYV